MNPENDINFKTYETLFTSGQLTQYLGQFIAIVDGHLVDYDADEGSLLGE
ncbi:hypothetical protein HYZ41_00075 [archaeon]|nr:hypothetical protein [archaeon]